MLNFETIRMALLDRNLSAVSRNTGVSVNTLIKMRDGKFDSLYTSKVMIVSDYLKSTGVRDNG